MARRLVELPILTEADVPVLGLLSNTLRTELLHETRLPHLVSHPLFNLASQVDSPWFRASIELAVTFGHLFSHDDLFSAGKECPDAYLLLRGGLMYDQNPETSRVAAVVETPVAVGTWFCEAALWANWDYVGNMRATATSQYLKVNADTLLDGVKRSQSTIELLRRYGKNFHMRLTSAGPPSSPWPDDLQVAFTHSSDLIGADVSLSLLKLIEKKLVSQEVRDKLESEVRSERCSLLENKDGSFHRVVAVVALRLERDNGDIFVQLGKVKTMKDARYTVGWSDEAQNGKRVKAGCELPGTKRNLGELPQAALATFLEGELAPLNGYVILENSHQEVFEKESPTYGMPTTYLRTTHTARLDDTAGQPTLTLATTTAAVMAPTWINADGQKETPTVYAITLGEEVTYYCWVSEAQFSILSSSGAYASALHSWVSALKVVDLGASPNLSSAGGRQSEVGTTPLSTIQSESDSSIDLQAAASGTPRIPRLESDNDWLSLAADDAGPELIV